MPDKYQSRTSGELIPVHIVEFNGMNDLWIQPAQWSEMGGYTGFIKEYAVRPGDIKEVHYALLKNPNDFPKKEWEP